MNGSVFRGVIFCVLVMLGGLAEPIEAQERYDVTGIVADSAGGALNGAMVVALTLPDSVLTKFALTNGEGAFTIRRLPAGQYLLQITLLGHKTVRTDFSVTNDNVDAGTINIAILAVELEPLVISVDHVPFVNKRDTLDYNALAFETRPQATLEDLLRRLPGVEVADDGSITAQGEAVQNVLVEGKEFFGSDPTIATRNLPADAVQRVQIYDKQSDMAEFTGILDGDEERTINIELKEDSKNIVFGNVAGAGGSGLASAASLAASGNDRVRYHENFNLSRFSPTTQLAALANINNVNQAGFSWGNFLNFSGGARALRRDGGGGRGDRGGGGGGIQVGGGRDDGFTETMSFGLNASHDFGGDSWIRSSYFFSDLGNFQNRAVQQQLLLGSSVSSLLNQTSDQQTDNQTHRLNLNAQKTFSDGHDFRIRADLNTGSSSMSSVGFQESNTSSGQPQNTAETIYVVDGDDLGGNARLTWRKRLNDDGRSIVAEVRANINEPDLSANLTSTTGFFEVGDVVTYDEVVQQQLRTGRTLGQSQRLSITQPMGTGRVLEVFGERSSVDEDQTQAVYDLLGSSRVFNAGLSSGFDRTYSYLRGGLRFNSTSEDTRFVLGLQVQGSNLDGTVLDRDVTISNGYTHVLPSANLRLQLDAGKTVDIRYTTSTREPSMTELQPFADNNNPLRAYVGNPDLKPEYTHAVSAQYRFFDQFSFLSFFTSVRASYTKDNIVQSRSVDAQARQAVMPINSDYGWSTNGSATLGTPIRRLGAKINLNYNVSYSTGSEIVNSAENVSKIWRNTIDASLENRDKDIFDLRTGVRLTFNDVNYSLNQELNQGYVNRTYYGSATYYLGPAWTFTTSMNYRVFDESVFGPGNNVALLGASVSRLVMDERIQVQFSGFDLLNQNQGVTLTNTSAYIQEERIESLRQYVMMKLTYRLGPSRGSLGGMRHR